MKIKKETYISEQTKQLEKQVEDSLKRDKAVFKATTLLEKLDDETKEAIYEILSSGKRDFNTK